MDIQVISGLTDAVEPATIPAMARPDPEIAAQLRASPESFGTWLKYVRQLSGLNQEDAAKDAAVSFDSVKRMERGLLVGSAHLLAWLAWLDEFPTIHDAEEMAAEFKRWPEKLMALGEFVREHGMAIQEPKAKSVRDRPGFSVKREAARITRLERQNRQRKKKLSR